jgi:anti-sigma regulatory factor (Ser/Thr protein kinase)
VNLAQTCFSLTDPADVGNARRAAVDRAKRIGLSETDSGRVALVVTEAGTNMLKHAGRGELVIGERSADGSRGIEILALDRGPGMPDVDRCLVDGYSTAGSAGTGLGAMRRLCSTFEAYSAVGLGTALLLRIETGPPPSKVPGSARVGAVSVPIRGENVCGDQWGIVMKDGRAVLSVIDGLGHGRPACEAAELAVRIVHEHAEEAPDQILLLAHGALRSTRGAAGAVAEIVFAEQRVRYAGIGNISGTLVTAQSSRGMASQNGTLGVEARRFQNFDYPLPADTYVVMHSDGLSTHWNLQRYPGLLARDPSLIAAVIYRDHTRGRDDATIVVMREEWA